jgi:hypothetical protein
MKLVLEKVDEEFLRKRTNFFDVLNIKNSKGNSN